MEMVCLDGAYDSFETYADIWHISGAKPCISIRKGAFIQNEGARGRALIIGSINSAKKAVVFMIWGCCTNKFRWLIRAISYTLVTNKCKMGIV